MAKVNKVDYEYREGIEYFTIHVLPDTTHEGERLAGRFEHNDVEVETRVKNGELLMHISVYPPQPEFATGSPVNDKSVERGFIRDGVAMVSTPEGLRPAYISGGYNPHPGEALYGGTQVAPPEGFRSGPEGYVPRPGEPLYTGPYPGPLVGVPEPSPTPPAPTANPLRDSPVVQTPVYVAPPSYAPIRTEPGISEQALQHEAVIRR